VTTRRHRHRHTGYQYALAAACDECAHLISNPDPADGIRMAPIHIGHVADYEQLGWVLTEASDGGPPDIACQHYHQANWQGDHDDCCGKRDTGREHEQ
jgi:hypothetical protein